MAVKCRKNSSANADNHLVISDDLGLCCGDDYSKDYKSADIDISGSSTVAAVNLTKSGGSAQTITLNGGTPIDWTDEDNDDTIVEALETAINSLDGCFLLDGGIEFDRSTADVLVIWIRDSGLVFNWIGTASSGENAFTAVTRA